MAQDCEKLFSNQDIEMNLNIYGTDTLVSEVFKDTYHADKKYYRS